MIELWILISLFAAVMQTIRSTLQKHLTGGLSIAAVTLVRFLFGMPFAIIYLIVLNQGFATPIPETHVWFYIYAVIGGVSQIAATWLLVRLFSYRNFAVGTTYSKTETLQTAVFSAVLLQEMLAFTGLLAVLVGMAGVILISVVRTRTGTRSLLAGLTDKAALIGIACGGFFAIAAVAIRAAGWSLPSGDVFTRAALTLVAVTAAESLILGGYMLVREPQELRKIFQAWRIPLIVGLTSILGSIGWFTAMTMQNPALVKTVGQIEIVFTVLISYLVFKERSTRLELLGMALIVGSILILLID